MKIYKGIAIEFKKIGSYGYCAIASNGLVLYGYLKKEETKATNDMIMQIDKEVI